MSHPEIYREIVAQLRAGQPVAQARVIQTRGSTPRKEGSTMLVKADGALVGTIGGGCGEAGVIQKARLSLLDGKAREDLADLTEDIAVDAEGVCGGTLRVFIQPWQPAPESIALAERLADLAGGGRGALVHQVVAADGHEEHLGRWVLQEEGGALIAPAEAPGFELRPPPPGRPAQLRQVGPYQVFTERWQPEPRLIIVGAGHIAEPLERIARVAGFRTVVVDDRSLFANRQRFPDAHQVICGPILDVAREIELTSQTYLVLVTRGHSLDMDALRVLIDRRATVAYIGMVGSIRRVRAVFELLEREGYPRHLFEHVRAPIGLNVGAETPAEIAVCIVAELISVRRDAGTDTRPLSRVKGIHPALREAPASATG